MHSVRSLALAALFLILLAGLTWPQSADAPREPSWTPPSVDDVARALQDSDFDEFVETSYQLYLLRFPQILTHYGFTRFFGVRDDRLDDYSEPYLAETRAIEILIRDMLQTYDRSTLAPAQQITYDVCSWYWDDMVRGSAVLDLDYLVTHYYITSRDWSLYDLMTVVHPLTSLRGAEDYVTRLSQVARQFDQLIAQLDARAGKGIVAPRLILSQAVSNLYGLAHAGLQSHPLYTTLSEAMATASWGAATERTALLDEAAAIMEDEVLPAYRRLYDKLVALRAIAPIEIGYGAQPGGDEYYAYALQHQNQTTLSPAEIHEIGLAQVSRLQDEIVSAALELGYPEGLSIRAIYSRVARDGGSLYGSEIATTYEALLDEAGRNLSGVFEALPRSGVIVVADPVGGYYRPSNGARPAEFAAAVTGTQAYYSMPTLTYHETLPGHHLQIGLTAEMDLPLIRRVEAFLGYTEGWALYAERLAWELGWYADDPYGNMGRLSDEMMRAVRLVVDTGIHAMGWSYDEAVSYFVANTGRSTSFAQYQIQRYIVWPGQSTSYMLGFLRMLDLRDRVQEALGDAFDLTAFHSLVLANGSVPLDVLEDIVDAWIASDSGENT